MTRQSEYEKGTPFSEWLRKLQKPLDSSFISNHNLDFIWHNYRENWLILIEEKRYNGRQTFAQKDTHSIVDQMLSFAYSNHCQVRTGRGKLVYIQYRGYYLVRFENTSPEDSQRIYINNTLCGKQELLDLLKTGKFTKIGTPEFIETNYKITW